MDFDLDKILRNKLYLQRFVTSLFNDAQKLNAQTDKALIAAINEFVMDADDRSLAALAQRRGSNSDANQLVTTITAIVAAQRAATMNLMSDNMAGLVDRELALTTQAMGESKIPASRGVQSSAIGGQKPNQLIAGAYELYAVRLMAEVAQAAGTEPTAIARAVRGKKAENFRDGLFYWRDNRLLRPNIDTVVNGTAANAASHTYKAYYVEQVEFLSTLDLRACKRCTASSIDSPYDLGKAPSVPQHPACRCVLVPWLDFDEPKTRPFVKDSRSVKDIPKSERKGVIGQTKLTTEQFFNRLTHAQRVEYMGPTRAALWKQGKITDIKQLVNERTLKPLTLDQLPALSEIKKAAPVKAKTPKPETKPKPAVKPTPTPEQSDFLEKSKPVTTAPPKPKAKEVETGPVKASAEAKPVTSKPNLSTEEVGAIEYYKGDGFYQSNKVLLSPDDYSAERLLSAQKQRDSLDAIIGKSKVETDFTVYRGMRSSEMFDNAESLIGKTLRNNTVQSTSYRESTGRLYAGLIGDLSAEPGKSVLLKIKVKKGASALNPAEYTSINKSEREIFLKADSRYTVTDVKNEGQYKIIEVDYED